MTDQERARQRFDEAVEFWSKLENEVDDLCRQLEFKKAALRAAVAVARHRAADWIKTKED